MEFGPFLPVVLLIGALVSTMAFIRTQMMGPIGQWATSAGDVSESELLTPPRVLASVLILAGWGGMYFIDYRVFFGIAVLLGISAFALFLRFRKARQRYVLALPQFHETTQKRRLDAKGKPLYHYLVIGTVEQMEPKARAAYEQLRQQDEPIDLVTFMDGYGTNPNNPSLIWDRDTLIGNGERVFNPLVFAIVCAIVAVFLAANAGVKILQHFNQQDQLDDISVRSHFIGDGASSIFSHRNDPRPTYMRKRT